VAGLGATRLLASFLVGGLLFAQLLRSDEIVPRWLSSCTAGSVVAYVAVTISTGFAAGAAAFLLGWTTGAFAGFTLLGVLFGVQKGLFFWSPALLLAVAGVGVARDWAAKLILPTVLVLGTDTYLIASWWDWQFGGSYGHRAFTDALSLAAVFMAAFFDSGS
jgi:hypothetical protein